MRNGSFRAGAVQGQPENGLCYNRGFSTLYNKDDYHEKMAIGCADGHRAGRLRFIGRQR